MDHPLGLLKVRVIRGTNLAVRDDVRRSSDPYVVINRGKQKLKTGVIKRNLNPEWNEELTLSGKDSNLPLMLTVYDHDTCSFDDKMGYAEVDMKPFMESVKMHLEDVPSGSVIRKLIPTRQNCLAEESNIVWVNGKVVQDICLRLKNVERGEVEIQLQWTDSQGSGSSRF